MDIASQAGQIMRNAMNEQKDRDIRRLNSKTALHVLHLSWIRRLHVFFVGKVSILTEYEGDVFEVRLDER